MPPARRYLALDRYLEAVPPEQQTVSLTFADLEALLGRPLPPSALLAHFWGSSAVGRSNWERSGFAAKLDRLGPLVTFTRRPLRVL